MPAFEIDGLDTKRGEVTVVISRELCQMVGNQLIRAEQRNGHNLHRAAQAMGHQLINSGNVLFGNVDADEVDLPVYEIEGENEGLAETG